MALGPGRHLSTEHFLLRMRMLAVALLGDLSGPFCTYVEGAVNVQAITEVQLLAATPRACGLRLVHSEHDSEAYLFPSASALHFA